MPLTFTCRRHGGLGALRTDNLHVELPARPGGLLLLSSLTAQLTETSPTGVVEGFQPTVADGWVAELVSRQLLFQRHTGCFGPSCFECPLGETDSPHPTRGWCRKCPEGPHLSPEAQPVELGFSVLVDFVLEALIWRNSVLGLARSSVLAGNLRWVVKSPWERARTGAAVYECGSTATKATRVTHTRAQFGFSFHN